MNKKPIIAFLYDFDKTLCTTDMQDYTFIPSLGYTPGEFWSIANSFGFENRMDGLLAYMYITTEIPQPEKFALAEKTTVYYNDGTTPIGSYAEQNREIISCADLPDYVGNAIVASEDRSFYTNKGIDPIGIARAFYNNLTTGSRQGGSTITQQ